MTDLETFTQHFFVAALWTLCDDDGNPLDDGRDIDDIDPETRANLEADCRSFWWRFGCYIQTDKCADVGSGHGGPVAMAGHDFWLTRCGHGAGFWDGDWPKPYDTMLTNASEALGNVDLYLGDDGKVHA